MIHELKGIMVNKGRIHRKLGNFERYLWNSIKSHNELRLEIRYFIILRKITQLRIHEIKNWVIWIRICRVIEVWKWEKIRSRNWFKLEIKLKLNLIYDSKLKSNAKWRKIKMKTCNLTRSRARNDPINRRIHDFSFRDFEDKDDIQDVISPYSLDQFLISSTPRTRKCVKKVKKSKDSQIVVSRQFDFTWKSKASSSSRRTFGFIEEKRHNYRI